VTVEYPKTLLVLSKAVSQKEAKNEFPTKLNEESSNYSID
jgi:hypothetical protein